MGKRAVVLFNLGGPSDMESVQPFLFNLFNDPAIIDLPGFFRRPIAKFISKRRKKTAQEIYKFIGGKSPILENTMLQKEALTNYLKVRGHNILVLVSMRYWHPQSSSVIDQLAKFKPEEVLLLPLYPQHSSTTTGSSLKNWLEVCEEKNFKAKTFSVCCYPLNDGWIEAQTSLLKTELEKCIKPEEALVLFSAHGLPKKIIKKGDPYQHQIESSAQAIAKKAGLYRKSWVVCYQSRVGPLEWIGPSTDSILEEAGKEHREVVLLPVAFVSEHSETLVELDIEYKELANQSGIKSYYRVPAVGTHPSFITGLGDLVLKSFEGQQKVCSELDPKLCSREHLLCPLVKKG